MGKQTLSAVYERHNRDNRGAGFVHMRAERGAYFRRHVGAGRRVLDLACRDGALTALYRDGNQVTGVDVDREALGRAAANLGIDTMWLDLNEPLPFEHASFDVAVAGECLEHLQFPELLAREVARVLTREGVFVGSVPHTFRMQNRVRFLLGREFDPDPTHLRHFSISSLRRLLNAHFETVEIVPAGGRLVRLGPRYFGAALLWAASRPRDSGGSPPPRETAGCADGDRA